MTLSEKAATGSADRESVTKATPAVTQATITYERLEKAGACRDQLALFKRKYGESVVVTVEAAQEVAAEFDWHWALRLLDPSARTTYAAAIAPARTAYVAAEALAWAAFDAAIASARAAYSAAIALARAAFDAAIASAGPAYDAARALAWASAFIESEARK